jgi:hypothetical protein
MSDFQTGHVKRNPETGEVALRTIFPEDQGPQMAAMAWLVSTSNTGARNAKTDEVVGWADLLVPPAAQPDPEPYPSGGSV